MCGVRRGVIFSQCFDYREMCQRQLMNVLKLCTSDRLRQHLRTLRHRRDFSRYPLNIRLRLSVQLKSVMIVFVITIYLFLYRFIYILVEDPYELFLVFHDDGYSVHEPSHCHIQHIVSGTFDAFKFRPDIANDNTIRSLCEPNQTCSWGDAVNVGNKFIYVSQPNLNRIVVIEVRDRFNPVEVRSTCDEDQETIYICFIQILIVLSSSS